MYKTLTHTKAIGCLALVGLLGFSSCKKTSPISIDNNKVISTPYSLLLANKFGHLEKTNDGVNYQTIFTADGYAPHAILTSKLNLLVAKDNLHVSVNNGKNFFMTYDKMSTHPWQDFIVEAPMHNRIYITSTLGNGIAYSGDNGLEWTTDTEFDGTLPSGFQINSFAKHSNGSVFAFSNKGLVLLKKENADAQWTSVTTQGIFPAQESAYFITSNNESLILIDHDNIFNHYISDDAGVTWSKIFKGAITQGTKINTALKSKTGNVLVGTAGQGIFKKVNDQFVASSGGLAPNLTVNRLIEKKNKYKNGKEVYFVYAATNKGLYWSEDGGNNWAIKSDTTFNHNYKAAY